MVFPQLSVRTILLVVSLIAADCAALRAIAGGSVHVRVVVGLFGILPMSNILAIASYRYLSRHAISQPYFLGFGSSGAVAILIYLLFCLTADEERLMSLIMGVARTVESLALVKAFGSTI